MCLVFVSTHELHACMSLSMYVREANESACVHVVLFKSL